MNARGFQCSVDVETHKANMASREPAQPVIVLREVLGDDELGWQQTVHQVRCLAASCSEYGWGPERAHVRGTRGGASVWWFTDGPIEFRAGDGHWYRAAPGEAPVRC